MFLRNSFTFGQTKKPNNPKQGEEDNSSNSSSEPDEFANGPFRDAYQKSIWQVMALLKNLNNLVDTYQEEHKKFETKAAILQLEQLFKKPAPFSASIDLTQVTKLTREASCLQDYLIKKKEVLDDYSDSFNKKSNKVQEDPLYEKIVSLTKRVNTLEKENKGLTLRIAKSNLQEYQTGKLQLEIKTLKEQLKQEGYMTNLLKQQISHKDLEIARLKKDMDFDSIDNTYNKNQLQSAIKTLDYFGYGKAVLTNIEIDSDKNGGNSLSSYRLNSVLEPVLKTKKICSKIFRFLVPSDINELSLVSRICFSLVRNSPNLISHCYTAINFESNFLDRAVFSEYIKNIRSKAAKNDTYLLKALKHHVHYDFNVLTLVEKSVEKSLNNIQDFKGNYLDQEVEKKEEGPQRRDSKFMGAFRKFMKKNSKDEEALKLGQKQETVLQVTKLPEIPLEFQEEIDKLQKGSIFDQLFFLDGKDIKTNIDPAEFREKQGQIFKKDAEEKVVNFMLEFNNIVSNAGKLVFYFYYYKYYK